MLEIFLILAALLGAAKRKGRRKYRRYIRGNVDELLSLGTLAARTLLSGAFDESVNERTFVSSLVGIWSMDDFTIGAGIGPIMVGVNHSDYSAAEVEEFIENTGSWNEGDMVAQEVGRRKIKIVGTFRVPTSDGTSVNTLNEGKPIHTKLKWVLLQSQSIEMWAYNLGTAALATTDPNVHLEGHVNLWPM